MEKQRQVPEAEAEKYAESVGAFHQKVSAKTGRGVDEVFVQLSKSMLEKSSNDKGNKPSSVASKPANRGGKNTVQVYLCSYHGC